MHSLLNLISNNDFLNTTVINFFSDLINNDSKLANFVYQTLMHDPEGKLMVDVYDFEDNPENLKKSLSLSRKKFFSFKKVSRILVYHEVKRTNCYK